jgi:predicted PurR-regulated permease PerM
MHVSRIVEYGFFFGLLALTGFMVWQIVAPFVSALSLAAIIVTICYPLYERIRSITPRRNRTVAAFLSTLAVLLLIVLPLVFLSSLVVREVVNFYQTLNVNHGQEMTLASGIVQIETLIEQYLPEIDIDVAEQLRLSLEWLTGNLGVIFAGTVSTIFVFFIAVIGCFYFFRDGRELLQLVIKASPLPDHEDEIILRRLAQAVRAVATGTLLVALIQGTLAAIGFTIFGVERAVLWGSIASVGALMPGVGTGIVNFPVVAYLFFTGEVVSALGLLIWLIDNLIGPYLMGRGNNMHPFIILIAVLGGISLMGPVGFVIGPVVVTLFLVLLEIYNQYIVHEQRPDPSQLETVSVESDNPKKGNKSS